MTLEQSFDNGLGLAIGVSNMQGTPVDEQNVEIRITPDFQLIVGQGLVDTPGIRWAAGVCAGIDF